MIHINRSILSGYPVTKIHELSLRILDEIGIPIQSKRAIEILDGAGCRIDRSGDKVFIPNDVVSKALQSVVPRFGLYDRSCTKEIPIGGENVAFMSGAAAIRVKDLDGIYRSPKIKDLSDMTRLQDSLENIDVVHELVEPEDIQPAAMRVQMAAILLNNTAKPCAFVVDGPEDVEDIYRMGIALRGSKEELRKKPLFSIHDISAEATLGIVSAQCDALIRCAEFGIPTGLGSYPIMGTTGPVTLDGSLALANANILCALVITQEINPGNPFLYMIMAGSMEMKNADIVTAAPEINAYYVAGKSLADHYRLPSHCIVSADSKATDIQLAIEKYTALLVASFVGINLIHGAVCQSDSMNGAHYDQILIDNELISMIRRMVDIIDREKSAHWFNEVFEDIQKSLASDLYFLGSDMTLKEFKSSLWESTLLIRKNFDNWKDGGMRSILDNSVGIAKEILKNYKCKPLDISVKREIEGILKHALKR